MKEKELEFNRIVKANKAVESAPQVDERLLKQVVHFILVLRKKVAHGENGGFVSLHDSVKL